MSVNPSPGIFVDVTLTIGDDNFTVEIQVTDRNTNGSFDLTPYSTITLFQKSTNFASDFPVGGITLTRKAPFTDGILEWFIDVSEIPTPAGQYYGKVNFSDGSEIVNSNQFDITVKRDFSS
jgi:hypothetical protein